MDVQLLAEWARIAPRTAQLTGGNTMKTKTMTHEQQIVVNARLAYGYELLGYSNAISTTGIVVVLEKGRHTLAINCLGYDEHYQGKTYKLEATE